MTIHTPISRMIDNDFAQSALSHGLGGSMRTDSLFSYYFQPQGSGATISDSAGASLFEPGAFQSASVFTPRLFAEPHHGCGCGETATCDSGNVHTNTLADEAADPVSAVQGTLSLLGGGTTINYYFVGRNEATYYADNFAGTPEDWTGEKNWTNAEMIFTRQALDDIEALIDVTFVEVFDINDADMTFFFNDNSGSLGTAGIYSNSSQAWADIRINHTISSRWDEGSHKGGRGYETLVHEIGHALGLGHTHDEGLGSDFLRGMDTASAFSLGPDGINDPINSIMAYNDGWYAMGTSNLAYGNRANFGAWDIQALINRYGANTTTNDGDTVYNLPTSNGSGTYFETIYDTGGDRDFISAKNTLDDVVIDLRAATLDYEVTTTGGPVSYIVGIDGGFTIAAGSVIERAKGGGGDDVINGNDADNVLWGEAGLDTISAGDGADLVFGGADADTIDGEGGNDELYGEAGNDTIRGQGGADYIDGGDGDDNLQGQFGSDTLIGGAGNDTLDGGAGNDTFVGGAGADTFIGGADEDIIDYSGEASGVSVDLLANTSGGAAAGDSFSEIENVLGTFFDDALTGDNEANVLGGGLGEDILRGNAGGDTLNGGMGNDFLYGDNGGDVLNGGNGKDVLRGNAGLDTLNGEGGNDILLGGGGRDILDGGADNDVLRGNTGADTFIYGAGDDIIKDYLRTVDSIVIQSSSVTTFAEFKQNSSNVGNDVVFTDPVHGGTLTIEGTTKFALNGADFTFQAPGASMADAVSDEALEAAPEAFIYAATHDDKRPVMPDFARPTGAEDDAVLAVELADATAGQTGLLVAAASFELSGGDSFDQQDPFLWHGVSAPDWQEIA